MFELAWTLLSQRRYEEAAEAFMRMTELNTWCVASPCPPLSSPVLPHLPITPLLITCSSPAHPSSPGARPQEPRHVLLHRGRLPVVAARPPRGAAPARRDPRAHRPEEDRWEGPPDGGADQEETCVPPRCPDGLGLELVVFSVVAFYKAKRARLMGSEAGFAQAITISPAEGPSVRPQPRARSHH